MKIFALNFVLLTAVSIAQGFYDDILLRGMVRDSLTSCPEGEIYTKCGKRSEPNCDISDDSPSYFHMCVPGCVCPKGTFRQRASKCVLREQCEQCPEGEVLAKCSGTFQSHYRWLPTYCVSKCVCPEQSLRELKSGKCVSEYDYYKYMAEQEYNKPTKKRHLNYFTPGFILQIVIIFAISLLVSFFVLILVYLAILGQLYLFRRPIKTVPVTENENLILRSYLLYEL